MDRHHCATATPLSVCWALDIDSRPCRTRNNNATMHHVWTWSLGFVEGVKTCWTIAAPACTKWRRWIDVDQECSMNQGLTDAGNLLVLVFVSRLGMRALLHHSRLISRIKSLVQTSRRVTRTPRSPDLYNYSSINGSTSTRTITKANDVLHKTRQKSIVHGEGAMFQVITLSCFGGDFRLLNVVATSLRPSTCVRLLFFRDFISVTSNACEDLPLLRVSAVKAVEIEITRPTGTT